MTFHLHCLHVAITTFRLIIPSRLDKIKNIPEVWTRIFKEITDTKLEYKKHIYIYICLKI